MCEQKTGWESCKFEKQMLDAKKAQQAPKDIVAYALAEKGGNHLEMVERKASAPFSGVEATASKAQREPHLGLTESLENEQGEPHGRYIVYLS